MQETVPVSSTTEELVRRGAAATPLVPIFSRLHRGAEASDPGWVPSALVLGAIGVVAYADHHMLPFSLIYLYILPLAFAAIFLRKEFSFALILMCIAIHYVDSPRRISLGLRVFHDLSALLCFTLVVYVIQRYAAQRESMARTIAEQRDELLKDLRLAEQVQRLFLPTAKPAIAGLEIAGTMHPARWLSGDYYNFVAINQHKLELAIADVSGKGLAASLLMSATAAAMQTRGCGDRNIPDVVNRLNAEIQAVSDGERFVTLLMAEIDTAHQKLHYINCGHNPGLWLKRGGAAMEHLDSRCPPIGLIGSGVGDVVSQDLENGDVIVLYTDGVTEAMDAQGEEFGLKRLSEIALEASRLNAEELVSRIVERALQFTGGLGFSDDVTVVVVKCQFD